LEPEDKMEKYINKLYSQNWFIVYIFKIVNLCFMFLDIIMCNYIYSV
jgi:hypothetical protein